MRHFLVAFMIINSLQIATSIIFYDDFNMSISAPSYPIRSTPYDPNLTSPISYSDYKANHATMVYVSAAAFSFQKCVDDCQEAGCTAVIFYTKSSLQTLLEIAAYTNTILDANIPVVAIGHGQGDFSSGFHRLTLGDPEPYRLIQALQSQGLQVLMWIVLIHRVFNLVVIIAKFYRFGLGIFRTPYPLLILIIYGLSSTWGIVAFANLAIFSSKLFSYHSLLHAFCLGVPLVYSGRILLSLAMDQVRTKANLEGVRYHGVRGWKLRLKQLLLLTILFSNFIISLEIALDSHATNFPLLFWLQIATLIVLTALSIPATYHLCKMIIRKGPNFQLGDSERRMRLRFAYKLACGTFATIMMWAIQILFIFFQQQGPLSFFLMYSVLSLAMSQVVIFSIWALRPSPRGGAMIPITHWLHSRASIALGGSRARQSKSIILIAPKPSARSASPNRKSYSPGRQLT